MKIEAVVICKDYSDFLEYTLPENIKHLDRLIVVTHPDDRKTKQLCSKFGVDYVETKIFHENGDSFNKARAINLGLSHLRHSEWLLHIDADIALPHNFRQMLNQSHLDKRFIHGADRLNTIDYNNYVQNKGYSLPQHQWRFLVMPNKHFQLGSRLIHQEYGYCPIGYFQLWHASTNRKYPIVNGSAEHSDVLFAIQWERDERKLLPEFFVYHLESDGHAKMGVNWQGRKTPPFGPNGLDVKKKT